MKVIQFIRGSLFGIYNSRNLLSECALTLLTAHTADTEKRKTFTKFWNPNLDHSCVPFTVKPNTWKQKSNAESANAKDLEQPHRWTPRKRQNMKLKRMRIRKPTCSGALQLFREALAPHENRDEEARERPPNSTPQVQSTKSISKWESIDQMDPHPIQREQYDEHWNWMWRSQSTWECDRRRCVRRLVLLSKKAMEGSSYLRLEPWGHSSINLSIKESEPINPRIVGWNLHVSFYENTLPFSLFYVQSSPE